MSEIRPPDDVVKNPDKPTKKGVVSNNQETSTIRVNKKRLFDIWLGLVIFIAASIELFSWFLPQDRDYLLFWYPLLNTFTLIVFSSFFVVKAFRYKSCVYSKIASIGYASLNLISFLAVLLPDAKVVTMLMFAYPVIVICIILSLLILFTKWILQKHA